MKHFLIQWTAVWLVLVSAAGCDDRSVGSSEKPTSSPADPVAAAKVLAAPPVAAIKVTPPAPAADPVAAAAKVTPPSAASPVAAAKVPAAPPVAATKVTPAAPAAAAVAVAAAKVNTSAPAAVTADIDAAQALFKRNSCNKCHSVDKTKTGPSLQKIAAKYRGKADGQEKIIKNMTMAPKIKFEDGTEEEHKVIDTKDQKELKNLSDWILSQ